jgi:hypothetical protein
MSVIGRFNKLFGISPSLVEEQKQFVNRINQLIFHWIDTGAKNDFRYQEIFERLCFALGENSNDLLKKYGRHPLGWDDENTAPEIRTFTQDDFTKTLRVLCVLSNIFKHENEKVVVYIDRGVSTVLSHATCDLGIRWKDGLFYPSGAEELDKALIEEPLVWLDKYPNEREDYKRALSCYAEGTHLGDVVKNCYTALEGVSRVILGNDKILDNNKNALLAHIGLSDGWNSILGTYINYAHDFRHASEERYTASKEEAEAFLYMTGLIMRLLISKK